MTVSTLPTNEKAYLSPQITYHVDVGDGYDLTRNLNASQIEVRPLDVQVIPPSTEEIDTKDGATGRITVRATPAGGTGIVDFQDTTPRQR